MARSLDSQLNSVGLDSLSEENELGLASWLRTPRRVMASAANLFNLDNIAEHHETDSGHSSDVDEQDQDVFSTNESGEQINLLLIVSINVCCTAVRLPKNFKSKTRGLEITYVHEVCVCVHACAILLYCCVHIRR